VTRAIDAKGRKINYYVIINKILEFSFAGNKELKVVFFDYHWFDSNNRTRQNQFGMVEVKHNE
jgi:elongation factor P hydroxylase